MKRMGEEGEEKRSLFEEEEEGRSSKKDLLLPHTAADIVGAKITSLVYVRE